MRQVSRLYLKKGWLAFSGFLFLFHSLPKTFQEGSKDKLETIKRADIPVMEKLLDEAGLQFSKYKDSSNRLVFTDIGGNNGRMLQNFIDLGLWMWVHCIEPDLKALEEFRKIVDKNAPRIMGGQISDHKLESPEFKIPSSDLILCSHSLYYTARLWEKPAESFDDHLFTKLFSGLKEQGVLCVILQSDGNKKTFPAATNHEFESILYPIAEESDGRPRQSTSQLPNYATAEMFQQALLSYQRQLKEKKGICLQVKSDYSVSFITLRDVNFSPDASGKYLQTGQAHAMLMSYTRGRYDNYTPDQQQELLAFIKSRCHVKENEYIITHVNQCFVITLDKMLKLPERAQVIQGNSPNSDGIQLNCSI